MAVLFLVVFVDLVGFGLLIPLLPFYVQRVGAGVELITIVLGLYSLAQFAAAPLWGRLSDRYGRKPVLAVTLAGLAGSYLLLAVADSLALVIASRIAGGLMAGNIAAAQAYVADVTAPEARARGMGLLGAAFGLGFILGPAIGGLLAGGDPANVDFFAPAIGAMILSLAAALGVVIFLKESLAPDARARAGAARATLAQKLRAGLGRRTLAVLVLAGFLAMTAWAQFETTFALWADAVLAYGPREIGFVLGAMGVVSALVQGVLMGPLTRRFGERALARAALALFAAGYVAAAMTASLAPLIAACGLLALASALFNPTAGSLVSQQAAPHEHGLVMGAYQSAAALGRVAGPAFAGGLFALAAPLPFLAAAVLAALALVLLAFAGGPVGTQVKTRPAPRG